MEWLSPGVDPETTEGAVPREFTLNQNGRPVTGVLWQPGSPRPGAPLVCLGHGASGDRHQPPIPDLARALVRDEGAFALSLDGPVHGRRRQGSGGRQAFWPEWERPGTVEDMVADWRAALAAVQDLPEVGAGPVGYWGLSMGTIYGAPFVAAEPKITAAVLGLMGIAGPDHYRPTIEAAARRITCPVLFIAQLEDELFTREQCIALFDALGTDNKRLHANPGLHPDVPLEELRHSREFLGAHLRGEPEPRGAAFKVSE